MITFLQVASDLLVTSGAGKKKSTLKIRQDPKKGFYGKPIFVMHKTTPRPQLMD